jgi:lipopolysaccharide biosynthesis glycosyltransferase
VTGQNLVTGQNPNERCAIVCAVTGDHAFALAALIAGFRRHNPDYTGAFVVFHDGLTMVEQDQLRDLWPNILFRPYGRDVLAQRFGATVDLSTILQQVSPMIFAKFEIPDVLADFDKCLWLDADVLVQGNLAEVWNFDLLAWRPLPHGAFARRVAVMKTFADMCGDGHLPLLNGGVLGMGRGLKIASRDLYAMATRLITQTNTASLDELALYFLAASRGVPVDLLDQRFNHPVVAAGGRDAAVVHAIGPDKFWNAAPLKLAYPEWAQNLQDWQGAGYTGPERLAEVQAATPDMALKAARNRAFWHQIYTDIRPDLPPCLQVDLQSDGKTLRFFHSSTAQLCLTRQANARRIGVEVHFAEDESLGAALERVDMSDLLNGETLKLAQTKHGWSYTVVVQVGRCAQVMGVLAQALDHATSRAKS